MPRGFVYVLVWKVQICFAVIGYQTARWKVMLLHLAKRLAEELWSDNLETAILDVISEMHPDFLS